MAIPQFTLDRSALDFLLRQVTIGTDYSQLANAVDPSGLREVSGQNNNLVGSTVGQAVPFVPGPYSSVGQTDTNFLRLSPTSYDPAGPDAAYAALGNGSGPGNTVGDVADATPRLVSNLVATSFLSGPDANPAAIEAVTDFYGVAPTDPAYLGNPDIAVLPNAGVLGGGRFNAWFNAFGQFFDHGLDFIQKGASGTITIDIKPGDPLYVDPSDPGYMLGVSNVMRVSRANLANPDTDFVSGDGTGELIAGVAPIYKNNTGLLIDQSQTYGSHATMNAFLREYDADGNATGRLITGNTVVLDDDDPLNDAQATGLATWADIKLNAARIGITLTDLDIFNAPELITTATGELVRDGLGNAQLTGGLTNQAFLIDVNPAADPSFMFDGPGYDAALLDAHYITGDGRANENFALTAVHHVFHEEHNYQVENIKAGILATGDTAFIAQWQTSPGAWDAEKLFQAARLITESEYNHIAIDQYVGTLYGALPEFVSYSSDINMSVSLEFSQAVFRLGHSMLTETFKVQDTDADGNLLPTFSDVPLLNAFLNPTAFADLGPAAITAGLVRVYGNEIDEFVTPALQQSLLGQPLDLATINLARGRDVGLPTHNELRQQIYDGLTQVSGGNGSALAPYTSWQDYGDHLKHPGTLVNMIAAYARDGGAFDWGINEARANYLAGTGTIDDIRTAAQAVVDAYADASNPNHAAAQTFMLGTPTYNAGTGQWDFLGGDLGFWDVDLWIGGLAERPLFDGPLGTTFSYILLDFAQRQQDGDRFYYLFRTPMGTSLGSEIVENQFGQLVARATGLEHLNGEIFITPDGIFDLTAGNDFFDAAVATITYADLTEGVASGGHLIIAGNAGHDYLKGGLGDDTIYGDEGNDFLFGSQGNDHLFGGDGDDYIFDDENDDFITGGAGNDTVFAGGGALDTVFGDEGDDELHGGDGIDEVLGGEGDDMVFGEGDTDVLFGGFGNDYLDGGDSVDEMQGQEGNDWLRGGVGDDHLMGGDGNDLLEGGIGPTANDGDRLLGQGVLDFALANPPDLGFDVASYEDVGISITADLDTSNQNGTGALLDTYAGIEGVVGSRFNDNLIGAGPGTTTANGIDNLLVGGAGNDTLTGLGGDDIIMGDSAVVKNDLSVYFGPAAGNYTTVTNWKGLGEDRPDFGLAGGLGHFLGDNANATAAYGLADRAVFSGQFTDYTVTQEAGGVVRLVDTRGIDSTVVGDRIKDVELFQFSDGTKTLVQVLNKTPVDIIWNGVVPGNSLPSANTVIATLGTSDPDNTTPYSYSLLSGSSSNFVVNAATGAVSRTSSLSNNQTYTLNLRTTDALGAFFDETINVRTGNNGNNVLNGTGVDDVFYALDNNDTVNAGGGNDVVFGQNGNDNLNGGAGDDVLNGGSGNDTLGGGAGNDSMTGGSGNDTFIVDSAGDMVVEGAGGGSGTDTIRTDLNAYSLAALTNVENLVFTGTGEFVGTGNGGANNITGGLSDDVLQGGGGADTLTGEQGNDYLDGGTGSDQMSGGQGNDTYVVDSFGDNVTDSGGANDTVLFSTSFYSAGGGIENLIASGTIATTAIGNSLANTISGSALNDVLLGLGGNDTITGGAGNDYMLGGAGNDVFRFAAGFGNDIIADFDTNPIGGQDQIDLTDLGVITATDFTSMVTITPFGSGFGSSAIVTIGGQQIKLQNVNASTIDVTDFLVA